MPLPEGYLPREGDVLLLRAKVKFDVDPEDTSVHATCIGCTYRDVTIPLEEVFGLHFRAWEPHDKVQNIHDHEDCGEVFAVCDDKVWVKLDTGAMATFEANALEAQPDSTPHLIAAAPPPGLDPV